MSVGHIFVGPKTPMPELAGKIITPELALRAFDTMRSIGATLLKPIGEAATSLSNNSIALEDHVPPSSDMYTMYNSGSGSSNGGGNSQGGGVTSKPGSADEHVDKLGKRHAQTWGGK